MIDSQNYLFQSYELRQEELVKEDVSILQEEEDYQQYFLLALEEMNSQPFDKKEIMLLQEHRE